MKFIDKQRLLYCVILSFIINGIFFLNKYYEHKIFKENGIIKELNVKSLNKNETTFFQKAKYTKVAKTYFVTSNGDTIFDIRKNIWAMQVDILETIDLYLPLDSIIYNKLKPSDYQLLSVYRTYSKTHSSIAYFIIGPIIISVWLYGMSHIVGLFVLRIRNSKKIKKL